MNVELTEVELVELAKAGNQRAFERLAAPGQGRILEAVARLLGDRDEAQDVLQDALTLAWQNIRDFRRDSSFSTWIHRIAVNKAMDALRKRGRDPLSASVDESVLEKLPGAPKIDERGEAEKPYAAEARLRLGRFRYTPRGQPLTEKERTQYLEDLALIRNRLPWAGDVTIESIIAVSKEFAARGRAVTHEKITEYIEALRIIEDGRDDDKTARLIREAHATGGRPPTLDECVDIVERPIYMGPPEKLPRRGTRGPLPKGTQYGLHDKRQTWLVGKLQGWYFKHFLLPRAGAAARRKPRREP